MGKIAFLFSGQGAQYVGMGKELYENYPVATDIYNTGEALRKGTLAQCFGSDYFNHNNENNSIDSSKDMEVLSQTKNTQPCLFLTNLVCAKVLEDHGIKPDMVAGFSLGEISAIAYANVLSLKDAFNLVTKRGLVMEECANNNPGGMVAVVRLANDVIDKAAEKYKNVFPVNYNCPGQVSLAGDSDELAEYAKDIKELGGRAIKLNVSGPFHTPFMKEASEVLKNELNNMNVMEPEVELYSNMTGDTYSKNKDEIIETIALQASNSVRWESIIRKMYDNGCDTFIEVGAGKTLSGFVTKTLTDVNVYNVSDMASLNEVLETMK